MDLPFLLHPNIFLFLKLYKSCTGFCLVYLSVMNPLDIALVIVHWTIASLLLRN